MIKALRDVLGAMRRKRKSEWINEWHSAAVQCYARIADLATALEDADRQLKNYEHILAQCHQQKRVMAERISLLEAERGND